MDLASTLIFAGALLAAAGSPGPSIAALVSRTLQAGWQNVLPFLAAMWIGEAVWLTLAVTGLSVVSETFHIVFQILKYAGIAYLLYLAYTMWTAPVETHGSALPKSGSNWKLFLTGLGITLGNPKIMVFYLAILPTLIDLAAVRFQDWTILVATMFAVLAGADIAWMVFASTLHNMLKNPRYMRIANRLSAGMMAGAATALAAKQ